MPNFIEIGRVVYHTGQMKERYEQTRKRVYIGPEKLRIRAGYSSASQYPPPFTVRLHVCNAWSCCRNSVSLSVRPSLKRMHCNIAFRLGMVSTRRTEDDQQSGEHYPGGSSSAVHAQLYAVSDLRLVQLPSQ